ncbi:hypothetical protein Ahy_B08g093303 isoform A [Arachis hypogaea]|uniref:Uncharacterized protein n=1 Tax=Arachis hypogaea TaxID=3818 RepID=A0A444Y5V0_ARAHY|nr:hypothetical protein Ahy_B08g093303 isoform A [Arachis hypogaea]
MVDAIRKKKPIKLLKSKAMRWLDNQPVSVAIQANLLDFLHYLSGVFDGSTNWDEAGYIRIKPGISAGLGLCGIAMYASYPTI